MKKIGDFCLFYRWKLQKECKIMRLMVILILGFSLQAYSGALAQNGNISLERKNLSVEEVILCLKKQTSYKFMYNHEELQALGSKDVRFKNASIREVLEVLLVGSPLYYTIEDDVVIIFKRKGIAPEEKEKKSIRVTGLVVDEKKQPLPGVTIRLKGTTVGTATMPDGRYEFTFPEQDKAILVFSFIGMKMKEVPYQGKDTINVTMVEDKEEIEEVVVTGIFTKAKESFTGAATLITKEELKEFRTRNLLSTISNIDPSFNILENNEYGSDPNKLPEINIRGTTSVPTDITELQDGERANLNTPLFILDGFEISLERMMDLDQDEIESVTILKDASSTAIYGSRGANGVVMITSVQPEAGKLRVSYGGSLNLEIPDLRSYDLLDAREKLELEEMAGLYEGNDLNEMFKLKESYMKKLRAIEEGVDTYWLSQPLRTGVGQGHRVNLSGGDPAFRYSLSLSYNNTVGVMKGSYRNNFNGSVNITYLYKKLQFSNVVSVGMNKSEDSQYGAFSEYALLNPYWAPYDKNGELIERFAVNDPIMGPVRNPLYDAHVGAYDKKRYLNLRENFSLEWSANEFFKLNCRIGYNKSINNSDKFLSPEHSDFIDEKDIAKKGEYTYRNSESEGYDIQGTLNYARVFDKHRLYVGLNFSARESHSVSYGMMVEGFTNERLDFISMGTQFANKLPSGSESTTRSVGFTGNINYTYNHAYYVDLSCRLDGASSFGENSRFAPFYSLGVGWNVNQMKYFEENAPWLTSLRFKYNFGVTGSLQFAPYDAMTVYQYNTSERYDDMLCGVIKKQGNPNLEWQKTYQHNIGMDLSLFNNLVSFTGNYYHKKTNGLITQVNLPLSNGYETYTENMGEVLNQGLDLNLSLNLVRNTARRINWSVRSGIAHNRNKLLKLSDKMKELSRQAESFGLKDPNYLYREGESMDALYVVPSLGIDPSTGKEVFLGKDGKATYSWTMNNRLPYGVMQPKINGRLSSSFRWGNLNVSISTAFRLGANKYNSTLVSKVENADVKRNVDRRVYSQRWVKVGDFARYKSLSEQSSGGQSSRFVQKEKTFYGTSVNIDYQVNPRWLKKHLNLKNLSISYNTNDIFYWSTVRLERGTGYPFAQRHSMSLSITL